MGHGGLRQRRHCSGRRAGRLMALCDRPRNQHRASFVHQSRVFRATWPAKSYLNVLDAIDWTESHRRRGPCLVLPPCLLSIATSPPGLPRNFKCRFNISQWSRRGGLETACRRPQLSHAGLVASRPLRRPGAVRTRRSRSQHCSHVPGPTLNPRLSSCMSSPELQRDMGQ